MSDQFHYEQYPAPSAVPARLPVAYVGAPMTDQQPTSTPIVVVSWIIAVFSGFYMLPWAIAATRGKANQWSTFAINLLLGWTGVGWIVAMVLACTAHRPLLPMLGYSAYAALPSAAVAPGWYPNPGGPGRRYWDGYQWTQHYA